MGERPKKIEYPPTGEITVLITFGEKIVKLSLKYQPSLEEENIFIISYESQDWITKMSGKITLTMRSLYPGSFEDIEIETTEGPEIEGQNLSMTLQAIGRAMSM